MPAAQFSLRNMGSATPQKFAFVLRMWNFIGFRILDDDTNSKDRTRRRVSIIFILGFAFAQCMFAKEVYKSETLEEGLHGVATLLNMSHTWAVVFSVILYRSVYKDITLAVTKNFWEDYLDKETSGSILRRSVHLEETLAKGVFGLCAVASFAQELMPLPTVELALEANDTVVRYRPPIDLFTPFDRSRLTQFVIDRVLMLMLVLSLAYISVICNSYYNSLLINCASHFELLNAAVISLSPNMREDGNVEVKNGGEGENQVSSPDVMRDVDVVVQNYDGMDTLRDGRFHDVGEMSRKDVHEPEINKSTVYSIYHMEQKLSGLVEVHQSLLNAVDNMNTVMSPVVFLLYLSVAIDLCILTFEAVIAIEEGRSTVVMIVTQLLFVLMRHGVYCYYGNHVTSQAERTYQCAYSVGWYDLSPDFKRMTQIMMARAQRVVAISSAMMGDLSMESYADILNKTYSYFTILRNMRG